MLGDRGSGYDIALFLGSGRRRWGCCWLLLDFGDVAKGIDRGVSLAVRFGGLVALRHFLHGDRLHLARIFGVRDER